MPNAPIQSRVPPSSEGVVSAPGRELDGDRVFSLPTLPPNPTAATDSTVAPGITIPFQHWIHQVAVRESSTLYQISIKSLPGLVKSITFGRVAQLIELSAVIFPTKIIVTEPFHVDVAWTGDHITPSCKNVCSIAGAQRLMFGGASALSPMEVKCDLTSFHPTIKGPVDYNNTPKLTICCTTTKTGTESPGDVFVRGKVHVSYPDLTIGSAP